MKAAKTNRRQFLKAIAAGAAGLALPTSFSLARRAMGRPNIIFIMADDHTTNAISCYGSRLYGVAKTPNIDRIAAEGARLLNCFCTNSICVPSRATILTGQYSHVNGVYTLADKLDPERQNVAKLLQADGYQTAIIGKWHLKTDPTGFDHWNILPGQGRYHNPVMRQEIPAQEPDAESKSATETDPNQTGDPNQLIDSDELIPLVPIPTPNPQADPNQPADPNAQADPNDTIHATDPNSPTDPNQMIDQNQLSDPNQISDPNMLSDPNQPSDPNEPKEEKPPAKKEKPGFKTHEGFSTDVITDLSLDWLRKRDKNTPFFLMTHFKNSHAPWHFADRHAEMYEDEEIPEPDSLFEDLKHRSDGSKEYGYTIEHTQLTRMKKEGYPTGQLDTTDMDQEAKTRATYQKYLKDYLRCVAAIDENVGKLLDYIDKEKIGDDTIVIYTSDQGLFLGEHGYIDKRWMFEESLRMPLLVRYPRQIKSATVNDDITINADFAPTLLDYASVRIPKDMQGRSVRANLKGRTPDDWRDSMYYRYWQHGTRPAHLGLRTDRYKLIFYYGLPLDMKGADEKPTKVGWELYDLRRDPYELNNVYDHPAYKRIRVILKSQLKNKKKEIGDTDEQNPEMLELIRKYW